MGFRLAVARSGVVQRVVMRMGKMGNEGVTRMVVVVVVRAVVVVLVGKMVMTRLRMEVAMRMVRKLARRLVWVSGRPCGRFGGRDGSEKCLPRGQRSECLHRPGRRRSRYPRCPHGRESI